MRRNVTGLATALVAASVHMHSVASLSPDILPEVAPARPWWHVRTPLLLTLLALCTIWAALVIDQPMIVLVDSIQHKAARSIATAISTLCDWPPLAAATLLGSLFMLAKGEQRRARILALMLLASVAAGLVVNPIRMVTGRARPSSKLEAGFYGMRYEGKWIAGKHRYSSFPSAHTTAAMALVIPALIYSRRRSLVAGAIVVAVAWSRIYLGAHHFSDVVVGAFLGTACGWAVCNFPASHMLVSLLLSRASRLMKMRPRLDFKLPRFPAGEPLQESI